MTKKWRRRRAERDPFYELAKKKGIRSRAYFKLENIDKRFGIFKPGDRVIDLGAYPGGWLQYIISRIGIDGLLVGVDINPIKPFEEVPNVVLVQGDIFEKDTIAKIEEALGENKADVIVSDLSPNITGIWELDTEVIYDYNMKVLEYAEHFLERDGILVMKSFEGRRVNSITRKLKSRFRYVRIYKPRASRKRSAEIYFICMYYRPKSRKTPNKSSEEESVFIP